jgi:hypothetical protein
MYLILAKITKHFGTNQLFPNKFKKAEQEIENYKDEAQKQRKIIYQLEKERDRYINEASDLTQKVRACSYISKIVV